MDQNMVAGILKEHP